MVLFSQGFSGPLFYKSHSFTALSNCVASTVTSVLIYSLKSICMSIPLRARGTIVQSTTFSFVDFKVFLIDIEYKLITKMNI